MSPAGRQVHFKAMRKLASEHPSEKLVRKSVSFTAGMMRATSSSTTNLSDIYDNKTRGSDAPGFLYSKT